MNVSLEKVTNFLKPFLLQNIVIKTDKKILKRGKLKIFQIKQYYINLTLEYKDSIKSYELPYPYTVHWDNDIAILNYHLSSFIPPKQINKVKFLDSSSKSKLYDNLVYILPSEDFTV